MMIRMLSRLLVISLAITILFVSIARAGLEILAQDNNNVKKNAVIFSMVNKEGERIETSYKLPETGMLSSNMFYGVKQMRDYLWLSFSSGINKINIALLIADKKAAETEKLINNDKEAKAIEAGNEAVDKLEYTNKLIEDTQLSIDQKRQINQQVILAGLAYKQLFSQLENQITIDQPKYFKLISRIDDWNKEQEKNQNNWDY